jgi:RNA polymerase sigma factor (sigma-70 family)
MKRVDSTELARWFDTHSASMVLYARQWLAGRGAAAAEDVVQDVFIKLAALERRPENVRAWLMACVRHGALDVLRGARRRTARDFAAGEMRERMLASPNESTLDASEAQQSLAGLPLDQREVITLRIWGGATFEEIASITEMPLSTVYQRYRSGLESLRTRLESPCRKT